MENRIVASASASVPGTLTAAFFAAALAITPGTIRAQLSLPLEVSNWSATARTREPVSAGVPLPAGVVTDLAKLRVTDAAGKTVPAQFRPLSRWWFEKHAQGSANPSVKWVLCDFLADVPSKEKARYSLSYDNAAAVPSQGLVVNETASLVTVSTGPLRFTVSKQRFNLFESLWLDQDANGEFSDAEKVIAGGKGGGVATAGAWAAGGAVAGTAHLSSLNAPERVIVEESGPLKAILRVEGRHHASANGVAKGLYGYQVFITAYAGKDYVDVQWAVTNTLLEGDKPAAGANPYTVHVWPLKEYRLDLDLALGETQTYTLLGSAEATGSAGATSARLMQGKTGFTVTGGAAGTDAKGAAALGDGKVSVLVALRDFAVNSPKAISVSKNRISLELFPDTGEDHWLDPFSRKNHRMRLEFRKGAAAAGQVADLWARTDAPLRMLAAREWYVTTRAWDKGLGIPPAPAYARTLVSSWARLPKPAATGWDKYGELEEFNGGGTHWNFNTCFWKYLFTGDPKDFEEAESRTFYFNDMVTLQTSTTRWNDLKFIAQPEDHLSELTEYETPEEQYNAKVNAFAGFAWHRKNLPDAGHMPNQQVLEYYLLTGDLATRDALESQGIRGAAYVFYRTYGPYSGWKYAEHKGTKVDLDRVFIMPYGPRYIARPGIVANQAYEVTGDERYLYPAKIAAYSLRNYVRQSPIGYMADVNYEGYLENAATNWKILNPTLAVPSYRAGSDFQIGIGNQALYAYWTTTRDDEIRDAVIHAAKGMEWRAAMSGTKYTGFAYSGWADFLSMGKRYSDAGLSPSFVSSSAESFAGLIFGYLISGREELYRVIEDGKAAHDPTNYLYMEGFNLWEALWRRQTLDKEPPAAVSDLAVTQEGMALRVKWTAPGGSGKVGKAAEYQLKYATAPIVDMVKRWDPVAKTGWPDLTGALPVTAEAYIAKENAYRAEKEISFWAASNTGGEPAPKEAGAAESMLLPPGLQSDTKYHFALVAYDGEGNVSSISNVAAITTGTLAARAKPIAGAMQFLAEGASPIRAGVHLRIDLPGGSLEKRQVRVRIYDSLGHSLRTVFEGKLPAGSNRIYWDGTRDGGARVPSGTYHCRLTAGDRSMDLKLIVGR
jgi:hypothetical protein